MLGGAQIAEREGQGPAEVGEDTLDVLFIVDEVICGFGRTGNMWGSQTYDLRPDILPCAKALSSANNSSSLAKIALLSCGL